MRLGCRSWSEWQHACRQWHGVHGTIPRFTQRLFGSGEPLDRLWRVTRQSLCATRTGWKRSTAASDLSSRDAHRETRRGSTRRRAAKRETRSPLCRHASTICCASPSRQYDRPASSVRFRVLRMRVNPPGPTIGQEGASLRHLAHGNMEGRTLTHQSGHTPATMRSKRRRLGECFRERSRTAGPASREIPEMLRISNSPRTGESRARNRRLITHYRTHSGAKPTRQSPRDAPITLPPDSCNAVQWASLQPTQRRQSTRPGYQARRKGQCVTKRGASTVWHRPNSSDSRRCRPPLRKHRPPSTARSARLCTS
jgi:hypothetical protein